MPKGKSKNVPPKKYNEQELQRAVQMVQSGQMSYRQAAKLMNVPKTTISDHVQGRVLDGARKGRPPVFSQNIENELSSKIKVNKCYIVMFCN